jgi:hypothetical protein
MLCFFCEGEATITIPYPSLRVKQEEERGDQKESEEYLHVVR